MITIPANGLESTLNGHCGASTGTDLQTPSRSRRPWTRSLDTAISVFPVILEAEQERGNARVKLLYDGDIHDGGTVDSNEPPRIQPAFEIGNRVTPDPLEAA
jgi:hypothetical protein